jgi:hypothetical protein
MRIKQLEARPAMPGIDTAVEGDALGMNGVLQPEWGAGVGLPPITEDESENMVLALIDIGGGELEAQWSYLKLT